MHRYQTFSMSTEQKLFEAVSRRQTLRLSLVDFVSALAHCIQLGAR